MKDALNRIGRDLPAGVTVKTFYDQSILIRKSLSTWASPWPKAPRSS